MNDLCYNSEPPGLNYMPLGSVAARSALGDFSAAAALGYTADQIYAAVQDLADFVSGAHAIYDQHFGQYQQNAGSMSADQRSAVSAALNDESDKLAQLDNALQQAQYYVSGAANPSYTSSSLSGLGDLGISASSILILTLIIGAGIALLVVAWKASSDATAQALARRDMDANIQVKQNLLYQMLQAGQISPQDYLKQTADLNNQNNPKPMDWQPLLGAGVLIALIIGGVELAK